MTKKDRQILILVAAMLAVVWPDIACAKTLIWDVTTGSGGAYGIAADETYIYITGSGFRIQKRRKSDGGLEWEYYQPPPISSNALDIAADDNYIYVAGWEKIADYDFRWRTQKHRKSDGSLEWTYIVNPFVGSDSRDTGQVILADSGSGNYIYIAGDDTSPGGGTYGNEQWRIEKRRKDNTPTGGWVKTQNFSPDSDEVRSITCDNDYIYVGGHDEIGGHLNNTPRIEKRRKSDGGEEWSLSHNGHSVYGLVADENYLYAAITIASGILKLRKSDGEIEWQRFPRVDRRPRAIGMDDDYLYCVGYDRILGDNQWCIYKHSKINGALVWEVTSDPSSDDESANCIAVDSDPEGFIYIAGRDKPSSSSQWRIEKRGKIGYIDIGLRVYNSNFADPVVKIAAWPLGQEANSPLRIPRDGNVYGIALVDITSPPDPMDSGVRIQTNQGPKALMRLPSP